MGPKEKERKGKEEREKESIYLGPVSECEWVLLILSRVQTDIHRYPETGRGTEDGWRKKQAHAS
jgi:hypothetical protein